MTRRSSKTNAGNGKTPKTKERRSKEPSVEKFRPLEELNQEFNERRGTAIRSLRELTKEFQQHLRRPKISEAAQRAMEDHHCSSAGVGVIKKAFEGRGFGFITPDNYDGTGDVFLHFSDLVDGSARNLGVGTRVSYDVELDSSSGRYRAKNVTAISEPDVTSDVDDRESEDGLFASSNCHSYNRDVMLSLFKALAGSSSSNKAEGGLKIFTVPMPPARRTEDEQDPHLDDEHLIAKLEERLDKETGADALNMETFGACSGWTFEEAVEANANLKYYREVEEQQETTMGTSSSEHSHGIHSEGSSTASEDGRETATEVTAPAIKWSWEPKVHAKAWDDCRLACEETLFSTGPLQVFQ
jgi:cold shock CspA family protein